MTGRRLSRRQFCRRAAAAAAAAAAPAALCGAEEAFALRYVVASCMYGRMKLADILPEVPKAGAGHVDIWPQRHGDQREQVEKMGHEAFAALLARHGVKLGMFTRYDLGPLKLAQEIGVAKKLGARLIVTGSQAARPLKGDALKAAVRKFAEDMKPHVAAAEEAGVTIGIENHARSLIDSPDSLRWLAQFAPSRRLGAALAPYHLPQDTALLARLIADLGPHLVHFYAWQHGKGCMQKLPKEQELLQMPGRGELDFVPLLAALKRIRYAGWVEIFMHPVPRGIPILPTAGEVTAEINRARNYLSECLKKGSAA